MMKSKYELFWNWFLENKNSMETLNHNHPFINEIDTQINSLGNFVWETGPGKKKSMAFTISPNGDPNLLEEAKNIISFAPKLDNWEFHYFKQVKDWDNYFDVIIKDKKHRIDISKWQYVLYQYDDNTLDIVIKPDPFLKDYHEDIYGISEMILDSLVGEKIRIEKIKDLEVVKKFEPDIERNKSNIVNLRSHIQKIYK